MNQELKVLVGELNRIRLEENLSYADIAVGIGIDSGALYKILNGRSEPYDRTVFKIRKYLAGRDATPVRRKAAGAR